MKMEDIELKIGFELKKFVIEELLKISKECPDQRLRLQALDMLQKIADGMNKTAK